MERHYTYDPDHEHWVFTFNEWKMSWRYSARTHTLTQAEEKFKAEMDGLSQVARSFERQMMWGASDLWVKDPTKVTMVPGLGRKTHTESIPARARPTPPIIPIEIMAACFAASQS